MYEAKEAGRGRLRFFEPEMQAAIEERLTLRRELREAIEKGELTLLYQPQVDDKRRCLGAEALLRWRHPVRGEIKPIVFLGIAERVGSWRDDRWIGAAHGLRDAPVVAGQPGDPRPRHFGQHHARIS